MFDGRHSVRAQVRNGSCDLYVQADSLWSDYYKLVFSSLACFRGFREVSSRGPHPTTMSNSKKITFDTQMTMSGQVTQIGL